ncbi:protein MgtS [Kluyvera intermedia]
MCSLDVKAEVIMPDNMQIFVIAMGLILFSGFLTAYLSGKWND